MFGRDSDRRDMARVVRFKQANDETGHGTVLRYHAVRNGFRRAEQIFESLATVGFSIQKAPLVKLPALIDLPDRQRTQIVMRIRGRHERERRNRHGRLRSIARPPSWSKLLQDSHKPEICSPRGC